jgi:deoxycytidine triphosphate deaminase
MAKKPGASGRYPVEIGVVGDVKATLITGNALDPESFFRKGQPSPQGSSFDLTIGSIFDHEGKKIEGLFTLKPGHMVQVVSAEVFNLSDKVTGHVTYKTALTKMGIWALTVGIVDPGWDGPIATTLLNFSRVDHAIAEGDAFLRVSFFAHDPVPLARQRKAPPIEVYLKDLQKTAASMFPPTFLDSERIAEVAGRKVLSRIRREALAWVALIAILFTVIQLVLNATWKDRPRAEVTQADLDALRARIETLQASQSKFERASPPAPAPAARTPSVSPTPAPPEIDLPLGSTSFTLARHARKSSGSTPAEPFVSRCGTLLPTPSKTHRRCNVFVAVTAANYG